jgi:hypothetical protein
MAFRVIEESDLREPLDLLAILRAGIAGFAAVGIELAEPEWEISWDAEVKESFLELASGEQFGLVHRATQPRFVELHGRRAGERGESGSVVHRFLCEIGLESVGFNVMRR